MSTVELLLFGALCYVLGLVCGAELIPWLVDRGLFRSAGMSDERERAGDYRWARQVAALLLFGVTVIIVLLDALMEGYDVSLDVLVFSPAAGHL